MLTPYAYTAEIWEPPVPGDDTSSDEEALPTCTVFAFCRFVPLLVPASVTTSWSVI